MKRKLDIFFMQNSRKKLYTVYMCVCVCVCVYIIYIYIYIYIYIWWWLRRDPPPHMIVKRFGCTTIHKKRYINASIHSFIHSCIFMLYIYFFLFWGEIWHQISHISLWDSPLPDIATSSLSSIGQRHSQTSLLTPLNSW